MRHDCPQRVALRCGGLGVSAGGLCSAATLSRPPSLVPAAFKAGAGSKGSRVLPAALTNSCRVCDVLNIFDLDQFGQLLCQVGLQGKAVDLAMLLQRSSLLISQGYIVLASACRLPWMLVRPPQSRMGEGAR